MNRPGLTFRPRLSNSDHRRAWALLQAVPPRRRGEYIVQAILHSQEQERLETLLRRIIREELQQMERRPAPRLPREPAQQEVPEQMLDFLQSL